MNRKGFTLIELLVVVMMVGILTSVALPQYRKAMRRARAAEVLQMLPALYEARARWMIENGYSWRDNGTTSSIVDAEGHQITPSLDQFDIEANIQGERDNLVWTNNFTYNLGYCQGCDNHPHGILATMRGARDREDKSMFIYYTGSAFCCQGSAIACQRINIDMCIRETGD